MWVSGDDGGFGCEFSLSFFSMRLGFNPWTWLRPERVLCIRPSGASTSICCGTTSSTSRSGTASTSKEKLKDGSFYGKFLLSPFPLIFFYSFIYDEFNRSEVSSNVYTTKMITDMYKEEGGKLFDSRSASLGHTLQGGIPSPLDRSRAVRLALKCMTFMEGHHIELLKQSGTSKRAPPESAAVITIQGSSVQWVPVREMVKHADMENRRGTDEPWRGVAELVEALVARPQILGDKEKEKEAAAIANVLGPLGGK